MSQIDITVVIVSYNVKSFLNHCLQSIQRASVGFQVKIVVVDNASEDGSAAMIRERYPEVTLIANDDNVGFGRANNQGFAVAEGDAVLILNPDAFIQEDTLKALWTRLQSSPDVGAIGPKIIKPDGQFEPRSMRGFPTPWASFSYLTGLSALFPKSPFFNRYLLTYLDPDQEHDVEALSGSCIMARRSLLDELGGFDPDYFMYGEDLDLCYRIRKKGYRILYDPSTRIVHFKGESTRRSNVNYQYHFQNAMRLFVEKNLKDQVSGMALMLVNLGFFLHGAERKVLELLQKISPPALDILLLNLLIYTGRTIRFGEAGFNVDVLMVNSIYSIFYFLCGLYFHIYGNKKYSLRSSLAAATIAGSISAAFTYFIVQWAFSRLVVMGFALGMMVAMPGWRTALRIYLGRKQRPGMHHILKRRALIVGTEDLGQRIAELLAGSADFDLEPVGFVDVTDEGAGRIISGIPVFGTVEDIKHIVAGQNIQELIFSTAAVSYESIIRIIQSLNDRNLNFRIAPNLQRQGDDEITLLRMEVSSLPAFRSSKRGIIFKK
ncbi:MAG: glycosyltransferase [bacterium]|nr:glycosyltransferase [bacterium]